MLEALLVFILGLTPPLISVWVMRQAEARARERLRLAMERAARMPLRTAPLPSELQYINEVGEIIGDLSCRFNARSPYLRCAVNPLGPCQSCSHYQPKEN